MLDSNRALGLCIVIPTYNNARTIADVVDSVWIYCKAIIIVNDGSTDETATILHSYPHSVTVVSYSSNRGKGYALVAGFKKARSLGYSHVVTIDADGQHFASDIPAFITQMKLNPKAIIVGTRNLNEHNMPRGNTFANKFSNFWFQLQTGVSLGDTQSGFRLYPLAQLYGLGFVTSRYEAELELLVFAVWRGTPIKSIPVKVYYPPMGERVTHFCPIYDFLRISILNIVLCLGAMVYWPMHIIRKLAR